jgi:hypothetical protein
MTDDNRTADRHFAVRLFSHPEPEVETEPSTAEDIAAENDRAFTRALFSDIRTSNPKEVTP